MPRLTFYSLYEDSNSTNKYISNDQTESWFDYRVGNINYHCIRYNYDKCFYVVCAWFDKLNYKNNWHMCRFQTESADFQKAFNKIRKLCAQKDIEFNGGYDFYENTSGYHWKLTKWK